MKTYSIKNEEDMQAMFDDVTIIPDGEKDNVRKEILAAIKDSGEVQLDVFDQHIMLRANLDHANKESMAETASIMLKVLEGFRMSPREDLALLMGLSCMVAEQYDIQYSEVSGGDDSFSCTVTNGVYSPEEAKEKIAEVEKLPENVVVH